MVVYLVADNIVLPYVRKLMFSIKTKVTSNTFKRGSNEGVTREQQRSNKGATKQQRRRSIKKSKVAALQPTKVRFFELGIDNLVDPWRLQGFSSACREAAQTITPSSFSC